MLVGLSEDWVDHRFKVFRVSLEIGGISGVRVRLEPLQGLLDFILRLLSLVLWCNLLDFFVLELVSELVAESFQLVLRIYSLENFFVLLLTLLGLLEHLIELLGGETVLGVRDCDFLGIPFRFLQSAHL